MKVNKRTTKVLSALGGAVLGLGMYFSPIKAQESEYADLMAGLEDANKPTISDSQVISSKEGERAVFQFTVHRPNASTEFVVNNVDGYTWKRNDNGNFSIVTFTSIKPIPRATSTYANPTRQSAVFGIDYKGETIPAPINFVVENSGTNTNFERNTYRFTEGQEMHGVNYTTNPRIPRNDLIGMIESNEFSIRVNPLEGNPFANGRLVFCGALDPVSGKLVPGDSYNVTSIDSAGNYAKLVRGKAEVIVDDNDPSTENRPTLVEVLAREEARRSSRDTSVQATSSRDTSVQATTPVAGQEPVAPVTSGENEGGLLLPQDMGKGNVCVDYLIDRLTINGVFAGDRGVDVFLRDAETKRIIGDPLGVRVKGNLIIRTPNTAVERWLRETSNETATHHENFSRSVERFRTNQNLYSTIHDSPLAAQQAAAFFALNYAGYLRAGNSSTLGDLLDYGNALMTPMADRFEELGREIKELQSRRDYFNGSRRTETERIRELNAKKAEFFEIGRAIETLRQPLGQLYLLAVRDGAEDRNYFKGKEIVVTSTNGQVVIPYGDLEGLHLDRLARNARAHSKKLGGFPSIIGFLIKDLTNSSITSELDQYLRSDYGLQSNNRTASFVYRRNIPEWAAWRYGLSQEYVSQLEGFLCGERADGRYTELKTKDDFYKLLTALMLGALGGGAGGAFSSAGGAAAAVGGISPGVGIVGGPAFLLGL